jgi:hypothetical protein
VGNTKPTQPQFDALPGLNLEEKLRPLATVPTTRRAGL